MRKTVWKRACAFILALVLVCAAGGAALADLALRAYVNGFAAVTDGDGNTTGIKFNVGAQNGTGAYSIGYVVAGPATASGTVSASGAVSLSGNFPSGNYTVTVTANDGADTTSAVMTASYVNNVSTNGVTINQQSYAIKYVTDVTLNASALTVETGKTAGLSATVTPDNAQNKAVSFASSDDAIATVSADGTVTGVAPGSCIITCTAKDGTGKSDTCTVTVVRKAVTVSLNRTAQTMTPGQKITLTATVLPADTTMKDVIFTTSNATVASVNANTGEVTAVANGTAQITVTTQDGTGKTAVCNVTVGTPVTAINVWPLTLNLKTGDTSTMQYAAQPDGASNKGVVWTSSNTSVATVDALGKITAYTAGSATITATAMDGSGVSGACALTVTGDPIATPTTKPTTPPATSTPGSGGAATATPTAVPGSANIKAQVVTEDGGLNLRVDARKSSKRLLVIPQYAYLIINVYGKTWCHVTYNGTSGYVMTQFLSVGGGTPTTKPTATATSGSGSGGTSTATPAPGTSGNAQVKTVTGGLNLRADASKSARRLLVIPQNAYVTVTVYGKTWCKITYNGVTGYGMTQFLSISGSVPGGGSSATSTPAPTKPVSGSGKQYAQVTTASGGLNLRTGTSTAAKRIAIIPRNGYLLVNTYGTTWSYITYNGISGYVMTKFLTLI